MCIATNCAWAEENLHSRRLILGQLRETTVARSTFCGKVALSSLVLEIPEEVWRSREMPDVRERELVGAFSHTPLGSTF